MSSWAHWVKKASAHGMTQEFSQRYLVQAPAVAGTPVPSNHASITLPATPPPLFSKASLRSAGSWFSATVSKPHFPSDRKNMRPSSYGGTGAQGCCLLDTARMCGCSLCPTNSSPLAGMGFQNPGQTDNDCQRPCSKTKHSKAVTLETCQLYIVSFFFPLSRCHLLWGGIHSMTP